MFSPFCNTIIKLLFTVLPRNRHAVVLLASTVPYIISLRIAEPLLNHCPPVLQPSGRHPGPGGDPVWPRAGGGPDHEGRQDGRGIHHDQVHTVQTTNWLGLLYRIRILMDQNLTGPRSDRTLLEENWKDSTKYSWKFHHPVCGSMLIEIYFSNFFLPVDCKAW